MTNNDGHIAIFDSGVGGITVLHKALKVLPKESFIYYADVKNVPYGTKSKDEVRKLILSAISDLDKFSIKALVIACNTGTSAAIHDLRAKYRFPIIGMEPAVKPAIEVNKKGKVMVMATDLTLHEDKYQSLIKNLNAEDQISGIPMPELVEAAEEYNFGNDQLKATLRNKFRGINWSEYHTLVLGCTHFIYFKPILQNLLPNHINIIDGNEGTINQLESLITPSSSAKPSIQCILSGLEVDNELIKPYLSYLDRLN